MHGPCYQKDKQLLERVQHHFTRMIPGLKQLPYHERLESLGFQSLEERSVQDVRKMVSNQFSQYIRTQLEHQNQR